MNGSERNQGFEQCGMSIRSKCHTGNITAPCIQIRGRNIGHPVSRDMKICVKQFLIFSISSVVVGNMPGDTSVNLRSHKHMLHRIHKRSPWNFLQQLRWKERNKCGKVLKRLNGCKVVTERNGFRINAFYKPASVTSANDGFNIGETFRSTNCLEMLKMDSVSCGTSAVCFASLL